MKLSRRKDYSKGEAGDGQSSADDNPMPEVSRPQSRCDPITCGPIILTFIGVANPELSPDNVGGFIDYLRRQHRKANVVSRLFVAALPVLDSFSLAQAFTRLEPLSLVLSGTQIDTRQITIMATPQATRRLKKEFALLSQNPPDYIVAHPSERNILEWHYILTGPPDTPYEGGQYWGTLMFPPDYPYAPPAIRMHTPSGRFQPSQRLCLSISDFHPKSFNPAWEVRTILLGVLSFMTSEEMTTGSVRATEHERRRFAQLSRWWNATGGGSSGRTIPGLSNSNSKGVGAIKAGDGGVKFRTEWPELDEENWKWMKEKKIDPSSGQTVTEGQSKNCSPEASALRRRAGNTSALNAVVEGGQVAARNAGQTWFGRNKYYIVAALFGYVILARVLGNGTTASAS